MDAIRLLELLQTTLPYLPNVLLRIINSYSSSALLWADNSGSMYGRNDEYAKTYDILNTRFSGQLTARGFHHEVMDKVDHLTPQLFLSSSGATDLSLPLADITRAVENGICTLILFTDGCNNMASEETMYRTINNFYEAVQKVDRSWHLSLHFITCGSWWPQQTIAALGSLFGLCHERVEVTVTDVGDFIKNRDFNRPVRLATLEQFRAIIALRQTLPTEVRPKITTMLQEILEKQVELEGGRGPLAKSASPNTISTHAQLAAVLGVPLPRVDDGTRLSTKMMGMLNGQDGGFSTPTPSAWTITASEWAALLRNVPGHLPVGFNASLARELCESGDFTDIRQLMFQVWAIRDGVAHNFTWKAGLDANVLKRFECVLVVPRGPGVDVAGPKIDEAQELMSGVHGMAQQTRTDFLIRALELEEFRLVDIATKIIASTWRMAKYPYTESNVRTYCRQMLADLPLEQGARQSWEAQGDYAAHLAVLWCILANPDSCGDCGIHFGTSEHYNYWLGVTGMWARFSTDAKNWDLFTLLQTRLSLRSYSNMLIDGLTVSVGRKSNQKIVSAYSRAASRALFLARSSSVGAIFQSDPAAKISDQDKELAAALALSSITDVDTLSKHGLSLLQALVRKPLLNVENMAVFSNLSKCIQFGPRQSVSGAVKFVSGKIAKATAQIQNDCIRQVKDAELCTSKFLMYNTSFVPLFTLPPPSGWQTEDWLQLHKRTGINLETVPLTLAVAHDAHLLVLAKDYRQAMAMCRGATAKGPVIPTHPPTPVPSWAMALLHERSVQPGHAVVLQSPRVQQGKLTIPARNVTVHCIGTLGKLRLEPLFGHQEVTIRDPREVVQFIKARLAEDCPSTGIVRAAVSAADRAKDNTRKWAAAFGGSALWNANYEALRTNPATSELILDLECAPFGWGLPPALEGYVGYAPRPISADTAKVPPAGVGPVASPATTTSTTVVPAAVSVISATATGAPSQPSVSVSVPVPIAVPLPTVLSATLPQVPKKVEAEQWFVVVGGKTRVHKGPFTVQCVACKRQKPYDEFTKLEAQVKAKTGLHCTQCEDKRSQDSQRKAAAQKTKHDRETLSQPVQDSELKKNAESENESKASAPRPRVITSSMTKAQKRHIKRAEKRANKTG